MTRLVQSCLAGRCSYKKDDKAGPVVSSRKDKRAEKPPLHATANDRERPAIHDTWVDSTCPTPGGKAQRLLAGFDRVKSRIYADTHAELIRGDIFHCKITNLMQ